MGLSKKQHGYNGKYKAIDNYKDLPPAENCTNQIYIVKKTTGIFSNNRQDAGYYQSDGNTWIYLGETLRKRISVTC
jgi:hypothetical protein